MLGLMFPSVPAPPLLRSQGVVFFWAPGDPTPGLPADSEATTGDGVSQLSGGI